MIESIVNGTTKLVTASSDDTFTPSEARGAAAAVAVLSMFAASKITRDRVSEGKPPVIGFF